MATAALLTNGTSSVDGTSVATSSFTPSAGRTLVAICAASKTGSNPDLPTISGMGATWTNRVDQTGATGHRMGMWTGVGAAAALAAITFTTATTTESWNWFVYEITDGVPSDPVVQVVEYDSGGNTTTPSTTLTTAPFSGLSIASWARNTSNSTNFGVEAGWTVTAQGVATPSLSSMAATNTTNDQTISATGATSARYYGFVATFNSPGTTAQTFYPHTDEWDGTDPASGDVRALNTSLPAATSGSSANFGTSGNKDITVDPYTAGRTTTGTDSGFGWAIDIGGADGMNSTANGKRIIPAGSWSFQGWLVASPAAALNAVSVILHVYRVAAAPSTTRTQLFQSTVSAGLVSAAGTAFSHNTTSQAEIELEAGETVQATFVLNGTGQLGGLTVDFRTGDQSTDCLITVPSPGVRTRYYRSGSAVGVGVAPLVVREVGKPLAAVAVGVATVAKLVTPVAKAAVAVGVATVAKLVTPQPLTSAAVGVATLTREVSKPFAATGVGVATLTREVGKVFAATGVGVATFERLITAARSFSATAVGVAALDRAVTAARSFAATAAGVATLTREVGKPLSATAIGVAAFDRLVAAARSFTASGVGVATLVREVGKPLAATAVGVATFERAVTVARTFAASAVGVATAFVNISTTILNRITGGSVVRKIIAALFDD